MFCSDHCLRRLRMLGRERGTFMENPRGQSSPSKAVMTLAQPTGMVEKDWVQLTMTDWPLVQVPALVSQLLLEGEMGSLGLPISASTLATDLADQLKLTLKLMRAPQEMVFASTRVIEQSVALPFLEAWYWVQGTLAENAMAARSRQRDILLNISDRFIITHTITSSFSTQQENYECPCYLTDIRRQINE